MLTAARVVAAPHPQFEDAVVGRLEAVQDSGALALAVLTRRDQRGFERSRDRQRGSAFPGGSATESVGDGEQGAARRWHDRRRVLVLASVAGTDSGRPGGSPPATASSATSSRSSCEPARGLVVPSCPLSLPDVLSWKSSTPGAARQNPGTTPHRHRAHALFARDLPVPAHLAPAPWTVAHERHQILARARRVVALGACSADRDSCAWSPVRSPGRSTRGSSASRVFMPRWHRGHCVGTVVGSLVSWVERRSTRGRWSCSRPPGLAAARRHGAPRASSRSAWRTRCAGPRARRGRPRRRAHVGAGSTRLRFGPAPGAAKRPQHLAGVGERGAAAPARWLLQHLGDRSAGLADELAMAGRRPVERPFGEPPGEHAVDQEPEREDVRPARGLAHGLLGSEVAERCRSPRRARSARRPWRYRSRSDAADRRRK